jgi:uncharacterized protein
MYVSSDFIECVSPTPLLMVIADHGQVALTDLELNAYEPALDPKCMVMIKGGHFAPYLGQFKQASGAAMAG